MGNSPSFQQLKRINERLAQDIIPSSEEVRAIFQLYDKSGDGVLQRDEGMVFCRQVIDLTILRVQEKMSGELGQAMVDELRARKDQYATQAFNQGDSSKDGLLQFDEFYQAILNLRK
ncbi:hypothetical protein PAPYR_7231 [Paratrimastix pyriformis]|uniref:EF-hand domain-containing protein n=1 Tax=Paratrimastix pyriformis TaxID=342808 RepID=A0ABQ8UEY1_9EUKA|nr:hypothetical protein PAPYR_7231 [Paratrimastix pyriformis]